MARKCLFHVERFDSLHRHQEIYCQLKQQLSEGSLRQHRLEPTVSDPAKATGGQHVSVLTERPSPTWDNLSREAYLLWFWLGVALSIALVSWLVWDRRVTPKPSAPAPEPVRDQEWCHYPQPKNDESPETGR